MLGQGHLLFPLHANCPSETVYEVGQEEGAVLLVGDPVLPPHLLIGGTVTGQILNKRATTLMTSSVPFLTLTLSLHTFST